MSLFEEALSFQKRGSFDKAKELYLSLQKTDEKYPDGMNNLGIIYANQEDIQSAIHYLTEAVIHRQTSEGYWKNLVIVCSKSNRIEDLITCICKCELMNEDLYNAILYKIEQFIIENSIPLEVNEKDLHEISVSQNNDISLSNTALKLLVTAEAHKRSQAYFDSFQLAYEAYLRASKSWIILSFLAELCSVLDMKNRAVEFAKKAIEIEKDRPELWYNLGVYYASYNRYAEASSALEKSLELKSNSVPTLIELGNLNFKNENYLTSEHYFKEALALRQNDPKVLNNLGSVSMELGNYSCGISYYEKSVEADPSYADAYQNLGIALSELGKKQPSISVLLKCIELEPKKYSVYRQIQFQGEQLKPEKIDFLLAALNHISTTTTDKIDIAHTLAIYFESIENYEEAYRYIRTANNCKKLVQTYHPQREEALTSRLIELSEEEGQLSKIVDDDIIPIFIVGMPRSGTTLLHELLSQSEFLRGAGELNTLSRCVKESNILRTGIRPETLSYINKTYKEKLRQKMLNSKNVIDKMPLNFQWADIAIRAFPQCKIINISRSPKSVIWSIYKNYFAANGNEFNTDIHNIIHFRSQYIQLVNQFHKLHESKILNITYEKLVQSQSETQELLSDFLKHKIVFSSNISGSNTRITTLSKNTIRSTLLKDRNTAVSNYEHLILKDYPDFAKV